LRFSSDVDAFTLRLKISSRFASSRTNSSIKLEIFRRSDWMRVGFTTAFWSNDSAHRLGADDARDGTGALSPSSVEPIC